MYALVEFVCMPWWSSYVCVGGVRMYALVEFVCIPWWSSYVCLGGVRMYAFVSVAISLVRRNMLKRLWWITVLSVSRYISFQYVNQSESVHMAFVNWRGQLISTVLNN